MCNPNISVTNKKPKVVAYSPEHFAQPQKRTLASRSGARGSASSSSSSSSPPFPQSIYNAEGERTHFSVAAAHYASAQSLQLQQQQQQAVNQHHRRRQQQQRHAGGYGNDGATCVSLSGASSGSSISSPSMTGLHNSGNVNNSNAASSSMPALNMGLNAGPCTPGGNGNGNGNGNNNPAAMFQNPLFAHASSFLNNAYGGGSGIGASVGAGAAVNVGMAPPPPAAGLCPPSADGRKTTKRRRRKPSRPGKTAKNQERHFVVHNYRDHADDTDVESSDCSGGRKANLAMSFPMKLHSVLDQVERDGYGSVVSWQPHGRCFVIHKPKEFASHIMPKYFRQTKLTSFQRQLNLYGFNRLTRGMDEGGYYNEYFLRGKPFLCKHMVRTKVKGTKFKAASNPENEPDFYSMRFVTATPPVPTQVEIKPPVPKDSPVMNSLMTPKPISPEVERNLFSMNNNANVNANFGNMMLKQQTISSSNNNNGNYGGNVGMNNASSIGVSGFGNGNFNNVGMSGFVPAPMQGQLMPLMPLESMPQQQQQQRMPQQVSPSGIGDGTFASASGISMQAPPVQHMKAAVSFPGFMQQQAQQVQRPVSEAGDDFDREIRDMYLGESTAPNDELLEFVDNCDLGTEFNAEDDMNDFQLGEFLGQMLTSSKF